MGVVACEGYCGGHYPLTELRSVGQSGERFCEKCYARWKAIV